MVSSFFREGAPSESLFWANVMYGWCLQRSLPSAPPGASPRSRRALPGAMSLARAAWPATGSATATAWHHARQARSASHTRLRAKVSLPHPFRPLLIPQSCQLMCPFPSSPAVCNSSCLTCSLSTTYCASCTSGEYLLNGTCVSACGTGFFSTSANSSCSPCHPDCASCSGAFDTCTSCESDRPVLTASATCVPTCASDEYLDGSAVKCEACDLSCATCSGRGSGQCLSCSGAAEVVSGGACVATSDGCGVMDGFGLCLSALVTVDAKESASGAAAGKSVTATWWEILLIILAVLAVVAVGVWRWRKKEQARRRKHTKRFGDGLDKKESVNTPAASPTF